MATYTWATVRERIHEKAERRPFWELPELRDAFNEALCVWNLLTGVWKRRLTLPTVATQSLYAIPALMLYRMRITYDNVPLSPASREELNNGRPTWRGETTASGGDVPTTPHFWAPVSLNLFYLWPADAVGGHTLTLDGVSATPQIVEDADSVDLDEDHFTAVLGYTLHTLTFKQGGPAFAASQPLFKAFLEEAADRNSLIKTSQVYRRVMGLDRRDLKPLRGVPTRLDGLTSTPAESR